MRIDQTEKEPEIYGSDQDAWHSMLENSTAQADLKTIRALIQFFPAKDREAVNLVLAGLTWGKAAMLVYSESSNAAAERLQKRIKDTFFRVKNLLEAIEARKKGASTVEIALILGLDVSSPYVKQTTWAYINQWSKRYGIK